MHKRKIFFLSALALMILMVSCNSSEKVKSELLFENINYSDQVHLFGNDNLPAFHMDLKLILPVDSIRYSGIYQALIQTYFDSLYHEDWSADQAMNLLADMLIQEYRSLEEGLDLDSIDFGSSYSWQIVKSNEILFTNSKYISFVNEEYSYTGGAHGNSISNHYVYDLELNKILRAQDFFDSSKCQDIIRLQKKSLQKAGQNMEGFWEDGFRCNDNFYLLDKGFVFHYDQYEIASYATGPLDVFLSFEEIKPYLIDPKITEGFTQE